MLINAQMSGFGGEAEILCSNQSTTGFGEFRVAFEIEVALGGGARGNNEIPHDNIMTNFVSSSRKRVVEIRSHNPLTLPC